MRVIAEAYGREPLDREMVGHKNGLCYLVPYGRADGGDDDVSGVGFPERYVYTFDGDLFDALAGAFERDDDTELDRLWERAQSAMVHA
jgi:hypothetical protein